LPPESKPTFHEYVLTTYAVRILDLPDPDVDAVGSVDFDAPVRAGAVFEFTDNVLVDFRVRREWYVILTAVTAYRATLAAHGGPARGGTPRRRPRHRGGRPGGPLTGDLPAGENRPKSP
jgi:hypothetical protein